VAEKGNGKRGGENVTISGRCYDLRSRGADYAVHDGKPKGRAGGVRPAAAVQGRGGRKPTVGEKNANTDGCVFFYLAAPDHGEGAVPPPLSR
jgi:hypothetical protein